MGHWVQRPAESKVLAGHDRPVTRSTDTPLPIHSPHPPSLPAPAMHPSAPLACHRSAAAGPVTPRARCTQPRTARSPTPPPAHGAGTGGRGRGRRGWKDASGPGRRGGQRRQMPRASSVSFITHGQRRQTPAKSRHSWAACRVGARGGVGGGVAGGAGTRCSPGGEGGGRGLGRGARVRAGGEGGGDQVLFARRRVVLMTADTL